LVCSWIKYFNTVAAERETQGFLAKIRLLIRYFFKNYLLSELAAHVPNPLVPFFHKLRGVKIGGDVFIDRSVKIDDAFPELLTVENQVRLTPGVTIMTHVSAGDHLKEKGIMPFVKEPVVISRYAFIGVNSTILPGVTIGEGAVIGAGSVVNRDVGPYTLFAGNPAKLIRKLK